MFGYLLVALIISVTGISFASNPIPKTLWYCGAQNYPESVDFSYNFAQDNCPTHMADANTCCEVHDNCYVYNTQEHCDKLFCDCLNRMANNSKHDSCQEVSDFFCLAVGLFGSSAWESAQVPATTVETTPVTTTVVPKAKEEKHDEKHVGHLDIHLYCFEHGIDTCITQFQECSTISHLLGYPDPHCKQNFCGCASNQLSPVYENPSENAQLCRYHLRHFCTEHPKEVVTGPSEDSYDMHFLTINVGIFKVSLSVSTFILLGSFIVLIIVTVFWLYRRKRSGFGRLSTSPSAMESENSSSEQVNGVHKNILTLSWIRINHIKDSPSSQALIQPQL